LAQLHVQPSFRSEDDALSGIFPIDAAITTNTVIAPFVSGSFINNCNDAGNEKHF
jgi:hypothetical protein